VVDGERAWLGGMNVDERHLREFSGASAWRDTGVRIEGRSTIDALRRAFQITWEQAWDLHQRSIGSPVRRLRKGRGLNHPLLLVNETELLRRKHYYDLLKRIVQAKRRVWVTNAYFVPKFAMIRALCHAARSGADVRIIVPRRSDVPFMAWVTCAFYSQLLRSEVRVFEYNPTMIHAKTVLIDDWAIVGTTNFNHRSLLHDLEVDLVVTHAESRAELADQFGDDLKECTEVTLMNCPGRSWIERLLGRVALLARFWL
jgi:cardiolipin synthase